MWCEKQRIVWEKNRQCRETGKKNNVSMMKIFRIIKDLELHAEEAGLQCIEMYFKKRNYMIKSS